MYDHVNNAIRFSDIGLVNTSRKMTAGVNLQQGKDPAGRLGSIGPDIGLYVDVGRPVLDMMLPSLCRNVH